MGNLSTCKATTTSSGVPSVGKNNASSMIPYSDSSSGISDGCSSSSESESPDEYKKPGRRRQRHRRDARRRKKDRRRSSSDEFSEGEDPKVQDGHHRRADKKRKQKQKRPVHHKRDKSHKSKRVKRVKNSKPKSRRDHFERDAADGMPKHRSERHLKRGKNKHRNKPSMSGSSAGSSRSSCNQTGRRAGRDNSMTGTLPEQRATGPRSSSRPPVPTIEPPPRPPPPSQEQYDAKVVELRDVAMKLKQATEGIEAGVTKTTELKLQLEQQMCINRRLLVENDRFGKTVGELEKGVEESPVVAGLREELHASQQTAQTEKKRKEVVARRLDEEVARGRKLERLNRATKKELEGEKEARATERQESEKCSETSKVEIGKLQSCLSKLEASVEHLQRELEQEKSREEEARRTISKRDETISEKRREIDGLRQELNQEIRRRERIEEARRKVEGEKEDLSTMSSLLKSKLKHVMAKRSEAEVRLKLLVQKVKDLEEEKWLMTKKMNGMVDLFKTNMFGEEVVTSFCAAGTRRRRRRGAGPAVMQMVQQEVGRSPGDRGSLSIEEILSPTSADRPPRLPALAMAEEESEEDVFQDIKAQVRRKKQQREEIRLKKIVAAKPKKQQREERRLKKIVAAKPTATAPKVVPEPIPRARAAILPPPAPAKETPLLLPPPPPPPTAVATAASASTSKPKKQETSSSSDSGSGSYCPDTSNLRKARSWLHRVPTRCGGCTKRLIPEEKQEEKKSRAAVPPPSTASAVDMLKEQFALLKDGLASRRGDMEGEVSEGEDF